MRDLLTGLLKRNAADRLDFDIFFNHPFIRPVASDSTNTRVRTSPVKVPSSEKGSRQITQTTNDSGCIPQSTEGTQLASKNSALPNTINTKNVDTDVQSSAIKPGVIGRKTSPSTSKPISATTRGLQPGFCQSPTSIKKYSNNGM